MKKKSKTSTCLTRQNWLPSHPFAKLVAVTSQAASKRTRVQRRGTLSRQTSTIIDVELMILARLSTFLCPNQIRYSNPTACRAPQSYMKLQRVALLLCSSMSFLLSSTAAQCLPFLIFWNKSMQSCHLQAIIHFHLCSDLCMINGPRYIFNGKLGMML